jgi:hypothetical protein
MMIERESPVRIYNEALGAKGTKGKLIRIAPEGFYELTMDVQGKSYTTLVPVASTVLLAVEPEEEVASIEVER